MLVCVLVSARLATLAPTSAQTRINPLMIRSGGVVGAKRIRSDALTSRHCE
jgi:hypothetical protein